MAKRTKVLIVDDSAVVRKALERELAKFEELEVVGSAPDPFVAREMMFESNPDVISLDLEMPRMNGLKFLRKLMRHRPTPVVVVSSLTRPSCHKALQCLEAGAFDVLAKPGPERSIVEFGCELAGMLMMASHVDMTALLRDRAAQRPKPALVAPRHDATHHDHGRSVIAIGTSTGGPEALRRVLGELPRALPPIVVVQHMPAAFIDSLASRLDDLSQLDIRPAEAGARLAPGTALIAPGDRHCVVTRSAAGGCEISLADTPPVCGHRPSVEVLFSSLAKLRHVRRLGVLMTGMGKDGAHGLKALRASGANTIAQDEASCVVYGMPREAIEIGAAEDVLDLDAIPAALVRWAAHAHAGA